MEDGEEEEGKGLVMWFCVGQDCPRLFWAFEDNDGDSDRGFKAGILIAFRRWVSGR